VIMGHRAFKMVFGREELLTSYKMFAGSKNSGTFSL